MTALAADAGLKAVASGARDKPHRVSTDASARASLPAAESGAMVHILTCGSVDDGKSTLIGRLLWDASDLPDDQREMVLRAARASGEPERLDYSLLLDGLVAEREQGITIDIAWRYLDTTGRRIVLIDSPGHDQYTRNMASGASHADAAIMLIDARHGVKQQTRRHAAILHLMGVPRVVLAVNKMDLVSWSEERFREIERDFLAAVADLGFVEARAIPVSARKGDNVAAPSGEMSWFEGPTLVEYLESVPVRQNAKDGCFRMPVQTVLRDGQDFRGLAGTISSGTIRVGDEVTDALTGRSARVARIATMDGDLEKATRGKAVALVLDTDLDVSRGAVLAKTGALPVKANSIEANLVWLAEKPFSACGSLLLRTAAESRRRGVSRNHRPYRSRHAVAKARQPLLHERYRHSVDRSRACSRTRSVRRPCGDRYFFAGRFPNRGNTRRRCCRGSGCGRNHRHRAPRPIQAHPRYAGEGAVLGP